MIIKLYKHITFSEEILVIDDKYIISHFKTDIASLSLNRGIIVDYQQNYFEEIELSDDIKPVQLLINDCSDIYISIGNLYGIYDSKTYGLIFNNFKNNVLNRDADQILKSFIACNFKVVDMVK